jgi:hypothetical protein
MTTKPSEEVAQSHESKGAFQSKEENSFLQFLAFKEAVKLFALAYKVEITSKVLKYVRSSQCFEVPTNFSL